MRLTAILLLITSLAFGQRTIDLAKFAAKAEKSDAQITISDNSIDLAKAPQGYWLKFTGSYSRPINFKNSRFDIRVIFENATVKTNTSSPTLKFVDCLNVDLDGSNNSKILGSGNGSGQLIDFSGKWQNPNIHGFYLDQGRNDVPGESKGGAMIQLHGIESPTYNHGKIKIYDIDGRNANDEFIYVLLYYSSNASRAKSLEIYHTNSRNIGRDIFQGTNIDSVYIHDNAGDNAGIENNGDHISGFSLNNGNTYTKLERNRITNTPQYIYSGSTAGRVETSNNVYIQGTSRYIANQAIYTKSNTLLQYDSIITPKAKIAAIAQDKAQVTYQGVTIVAPKVFRYTTPVPIELPTVKTEPVQAILETTTLNGVTKTVLIYGDKRINLD